MLFIYLFTSFLLLNFSSPSFPNLCRWGGELSYFDKEKFATDDAMLVGRLPVVMPGWEDSNLDYMTTGGFEPSALVPKVLPTRRPPVCARAALTSCF